MCLIFLRQHYLVQVDGYILSHQMMLAAREDEMHMLGKLDIRT